MEISEIDITKCIYCDKPFKHTTKERKVKGTGATEFRFIMGHPKCEQLNKKINRTKTQLLKMRVKTSEKQMELVGLNYEAFLNKADAEKDESDNDCVIAILKKKDIL